MFLAIKPILWTTHMPAPYVVDSVAVSTYWPFLKFFSASSARARIFGFQGQPKAELSRDFGEIPIRSGNFRAKTPSTAAARHKRTRRYSPLVVI